MKISINWLKQYIPFDLSPDDLAERLTMVGLEVEEIKKVGLSYEGVIVGEIKAVENHPNAENLHCCSVDTGKETLSIVCGAPNVRIGQRVPVAVTGAILPGDRHIERVKIRGVPSDGMICSERELGISDNHEGILVLEKTAHVIGEAFNTVGTAEDTVLEVNVTPNRPDCLSHIGVSREISVITQNPLTIPENRIRLSGIKTESHIAVELIDPEACPRYTARVVQNVKIEPSPGWLKSRLESVGIRSINNVVDATNFVLMETGHPLHAFDYDLIRNQRIIVRKASKGEGFITLDDVERKLTPDDLLICDGERPVALAGIMGGLNSEVTEKTRNVLLESAYFDPRTIRKTAKRLGMSTEASHRFERGVDPNNTVFAIDRAAMILQDLSGGRVLDGIVDAYPIPITPWDIELRFPRIEEIVGQEIPRESVIAIMTGLELNTRDEDPIRVTIPTFRPDLRQEIDLIEELLRHYGFDNIEPSHHTTIALHQPRNSRQFFIENLRDCMTGWGFLETYGNTLVPSRHVTRTPESPPVVIQNPISPESGYLRTSLIPSLMDVIRWNCNRSTNRLRLFEIGKRFLKQDQSQPVEQWCMVAALTGGYRQRPFWGEKDEGVHFFHLKGIVEALLEKVHAAEWTIGKTDHPFLESETSHCIRYDDSILGFFGRMAASVCEDWDISDDVYMLEIDIDRFESVHQTGIQFKPISRFPSIRRDISVVADARQPVGSLKDTIRKVGGNVLNRVELFDLYRGDQVPEDKKSVAFSLIFSSSSRTLREEEVDPIINKIVKALESEHSAFLRS